MAGLLWHAGSGSTYRFFFENDRLVLDGGGEGKFPLAPLGHDAYRLTAAPRRYVFSFTRGPGARVALEENIEGSPVRIFERVPEASRAGTPLSALAGEYYSPELEVTWTVALRSGYLELLRHRMEPDSMSHMFGDVFQSRHGFVLEFVRGEIGKPATMDASTLAAPHGVG